MPDDIFRPLEKAVGDLITGLDYDSELYEVLVIADNCSDSTAFTASFAGAKVLGNVEIGMYSKIAAGSVVLTNIPPHSTAAGVPAKVIGKPFADIPAHAMNQMISHPKKEE